MLCVVSHDAGGAEVLASYIARSKETCKFVLEGPALNVFKRRLGDIEVITLEDALKECETFLCGTSWQSDLEWRAIASAKAAGKHSCAFLDHWGHYRERFIRGGSEVLPDEIWVGDTSAVHLARAIFPGIPLKFVANPYFEDIREQLSALRVDETERTLEEGLRILFVCEPLSEHGLKEFGDPLHWGYTEFDALHYLFSNLHALGSPIARVVIRPHPSERPSKYDDIAGQLGSLAHVGGKKSLLTEIAECDVVAGCESMAMVVGLVAEKRVIATIPPGGNPCSLPQTEIEFLQQIISRAI